MSKKPKKYTYHASARWTDVHLNQDMQFVTQLYKVGIYCAWYIGKGTPRQMNWKPNDVIKFVKQLKSLEQEGKITNLVLGKTITVSDTTGFWEET